MGSLAEFGTVSAMRRRRGAGIRDGKVRVDLDIQAGSGCRGKAANGMPGTLEGRGGTSGSALAHFPDSRSVVTTPKNETALFVPEAHPDIGHGVRGRRAQALSADLGLSLLMALAR